MAMEESREICLAKMQAFAAFPTTKSTINSVRDSVLRYLSLTLGDDSLDLLAVESMSDTDEDMIQKYIKEYSHLRPEITKDRRGKLRVVIK